MKCIINRRSQFSASHRYWLPELSPAENLQRFGKCTTKPGHGHNYVLNVSLEGELDPYGMVLDLAKAKAIIRQEIIDALDFSYLNETWPEFKKTLPTTEHVAQTIWQRLKTHLPIVDIQLFETPELWANYKGNGMEAYLTVSDHFSAAHQLALPQLSEEENRAIYGKCASPNGHGHNYQVEVTVKGQIDPRTGMIVDLGDLQSAIAHHVIERFDHTFLNKDVPYFSSVVPTAENIVIHICHLLHQPVADIGATLHKVKLIESPNNSAEVIAESIDHPSKNERSSQSLAAV
ncbi:6-carboxytetrahydropterin synthase [cf. Phormidesmis sp. LEGE 11477]|uniref:6-carboxytetrahydropterin synthase n=1 Tax=cf. Phormidesmis sp. LEGE 11477 TaxID=1828680 RepID=UPI001882AAE6|nr:6-carboxytetrahydropterin synthase [cf. Phormidesmis sp. LEGE 11477]MBE9061301.1 6-carboxytetrahydropterin synthase [cf. Phormidesmis sp. LEGE 11477]